MKDEIIRSELESILKNLKQNGFECYISDSGTYGYIITKNDNVLCIYRNTYAVRGWDFSLEYKQNRGTGTGCCCLEEPVQDVTITTVEQAETEGLAFAGKLKAQLYNNSSVWFNAYWDKNNLIRV